MTSTNIYTPILFAQKDADIFPTYLYIKQHSVTKLKYFGKTNSEDPIKYSGSGKYWTIGKQAGNGRQSSPI